MSVKILNRIFFKLGYFYLNLYCNLNQFRHFYWPSYFRSTDNLSWKNIWKVLTLRRFVMVESKLSIEVLRSCFMALILTRESRVLATVGSRALIAEITSSKALRPSSNGALSWLAKFWMKISISFLVWLICVESIFVRSMYVRRSCKGGHSQRQQRLLSLILMPYWPHWCLPNSSYLN